MSISCYQSRVSKSPERIPRPQNTWILFLNDHRDAATGDRVQAKIKACAVMWNKLKARNDPMVKRYKELAKAAKEAHRLKYPDYKFRPRKKGARGSHKIEHEQEHADPLPTPFANPIPGYLYCDAQDAPPLMSLPFPILPQPVTVYKTYYPYAASTGAMPSVFESPSPEKYGSPTPSSENYDNNGLIADKQAQGFQYNNPVTHSFEAMDPLMSDMTIISDGEVNATDEYTMIDPSLLLLEKLLPPAASSLRGSA
ncbi:hypothetical protein H0H92_002054 [Tricholoma furcatifolium]|nr:hypothetical protein H0H92_002054 [Tricholoma furcatifolium]